MTRPSPHLGLVVRYDFLWDSDRRKGREDGAKNRPCSVVLITGTGRIILCGISHTDPGSDDLRIELDAKTKAILGLDGDPQWIDCGEVNETTWDDAGFIPTDDGHWEYGTLPAEIAQEMLDKARAQLNAQQLKWIDRVAIEAERERREREG